jgi:hypothetical protein
MYALVPAWVWADSPSSYWRVRLLVGHECPSLQTLYRSSCGVLPPRGPISDAAQEASAGDNGGTGGLR